MALDLDDPPMAEPDQVDDEPITADRKAGFSSFCRRSNHTTCQSLKASCTCSCHGARGQRPAAAAAPTPPASPVIEEPIVSETRGTASPPQSGGLVCPECGAAKFTAAAGLAVHRSRVHGVRGASNAKKARSQRPPAKPTTPKAPPVPSTPVAPPARSGDDLVVRNAAGELRLIVGASRDMVDTLEWLGVPMMFVDLAGLATVEV